MSKYIMVIDEGTTGTRGILFDKEFKIVSQDYQELIQYTPDNIRVEHDASEIYNKSVEVCKGAMQKLEQQQRIFPVLVSLHREIPV